MATIDIGVDGLPILTFIRGGVFWVFLFNADNSPTTFDAWSSPDGVTWSLVQTGPQSPGWVIGSSGFDTDGGMAIWDGANTVTLAYQAFDPSLFFGDNFLIDFDLNAGTWGAPYAGQNIRNTFGFGPFGIFRLSSGNLTVLYFDEALDDTPAKIQTWNGVSWTALVDVCGGAEGLPGFDPTEVAFSFASAVLDASDVLHIIYTATSDTLAGWIGNRFFYQEAIAGNTLQNFQEFPGQVGPNPDLFPLVIGPGPNIIIMGGKLYWGILRNDYTVIPTSNFPSVYVGFPLTNPSWTELGNLFPGVPAASGAPVFGVAGSQTSLGSGAPGFAFAVQSPDGFASFTDVTITDAGLPEIGPQNPLFLFSATTSYIVSGGVVNEGGAQPVAITSFGSAPPPPPTIKITFRGVKRVRCSPIDKAVEMPAELPGVKRAM